MLKEALFPEEFVIDEGPVEVYVPEERAPEAEGAAEGGVSFDLIFGRAKGQDLLAQMTDLMLEQVRLVEKARQLELTKETDDEFARFVRQALPFLDNFAHLLDMARENPPSAEVNTWLRGVEALYYRIVKLFDDYGLRFINSIGKVVDLDYHEVVDYRPSSQFSHNTIIKEMQKGVVFRGRLFRDAKVVVACNHPKDHGLKG